MLLCPWDFPGKYWSGLPFPLLGDLPDPEMEPSSLTTSITWEALYSQSRRLHLRSTTSKEDLSLSECILSAFCQRARQSGKWLEVYIWLQRSQLPVYSIKFSFLHFYGISPSSPFDFSVSLILLIHPLPHLPTSLAIQSSLYH